MRPSRTLLGLTLAASLTLFGGCGGSTPEIDDAEKIKEATKPGEAPVVKPLPVDPPAKEVPKVDGLTESVGSWRFPGDSVHARILVLPPLQAAAPRAAGDRHTRLAQGS